MKQQVTDKNVKMRHFDGLAHQAADFLQKEHLCNVNLWKKFVDIYRSRTDGTNMGWRGEYWGKMMRGAALIYEYTQDETLYQVLTDSVRDLMTTADSDGRVSSYTRETEFDGWDLWGRKYILLGCEYYLEICKDDELKKDILAFCVDCADYILEHIGPQKKKITAASRHWYGLNSSSILEPMVILYRLTNEKKYLDFAAYIVDEGGAEGINVFELAYENRLYPYQYGISKAYELTSCFEGLLEYYKVTGIEKHKTAVLNYAKAVLDSEMSIIGSSGITHELFDHTRVRQTAQYDGVKQETCVTVTLMKFFSRLLEITGDSVYADTIEKSFYNAYLGALNTGHCESDYPKEYLKQFPDKTLVPTDLPFDSYSPLTPDKRGKVIGGFQVLPDTSYYGCCACIGAAGAGIFLKHAVVVDSDSVTINFYERGRVEFTYDKVPVSLEIATDYPVDGHIELRILAECPVRFKLKLRNPAWADVPHGYTVYEKTWESETITLNWDMPIKLHFPESWEEDTIYTDLSGCTDLSYVAAPVKAYHLREDDNYVAVTRGPLTLAADSRTGKPADSAFSVTTDAVRCEPNITDGVPCLLKLKFEPENQEAFFLVDYAHAGRDWKTKIAAWLPTDQN